MDQPFITFYYTTEKTDTILEPGDTIGSAWQRAARSFGSEASRPASFKSGGLLVSASDPARAGQAVSVTVTHDPKGA